MHAVHVPELFCPIEPRINSHVNAARAHNLKWVHEFNLVPTRGPRFQKFVDSKFASLSGRTFPDATLEDLKIILDFSTWLFCRDDRYDHIDLTPTTQQMMALDRGLIALLEGRSPEDNLPPDFHALHDVFARLQKRAHRSWLKRFVYNVEAYFQGNHWEAQNRAEGITPDVSTYVQLRQFASAVYPSFDFILLVHGIDPDTKFLHHVYLRQLTEMANNYVCWVNDVFGVTKESHEGNTSNLVFVLQAQYNVPLRHAIDTVTRRCDAEMRAFLRLQERLPSFDPPQDAQAQQYIGNLRDWMRGNLDWSLESRRYLG